MNANQLHTELEELYGNIKSGRVKVPVAVELNNTAGKIIALTKLQLDHARFQRELGKESAAIPLLEAPKKAAR